MHTLHKVNARREASELNRIQELWWRLESDQEYELKRDFDGILVVIQEYFILLIAEKGFSLYNILLKKIWQSEFFIEKY